MTQKEIIEMAQGNPGALNILIGLYNYNGNSLIPKAVLNEIKEDSNLRGTNIYVLFNDLCDGKIENVFELIQNCPRPILTDAYTKQDYSGKKLIEKYLNFKSQKK